MTDLKADVERRMEDAWASDGGDRFERTVAVCMEVVQEKASEWIKWCSDEVESEKAEAVQAERERCANICDGVAKEADPDDTPDSTAIVCRNLILADAIRSEGQWQKRIEAAVQAERERCLRMVPTGPCQHQGGCNAGVDGCMWELRQIADAIRNESKLPSDIDTEKLARSYVNDPHFNEPPRQDRCPTCGGRGFSTTHYGEPCPDCKPDLLMLAEARLETWTTAEHNTHESIIRYRQKAHAEVERLKG